MSTSPKYVVVVQVTEPLSREAAEAFAAGVRTSGTVAVMVAQEKEVASGSAAA